MFEAYKIGVAISLTNHVSPILAAISRDFAKTNAEAAAFQKKLDSIKMGMLSGVMMAGTGVALAAMFRTPIHDALEFERALLRIKNIGGIDSVTLAGVRGDALAGKYKGVGATESLNLFRDLHAAFGEAEHAKEFMPLFAGMARVTQGLYGKSAVASEEDVKALAKFAERRGGTKSPEAMESAMDISMKMLNASGGAVSPKDLLAFSARMGAMGNAMSDTGLLKMWALMQEQGGSKAGTALNSAMQNLVNGRGTEGAGNVLRRIGWVDEEKNKEGLKGLYGENWSKHLNKVTANSLKNVAEAKEDMVGWVQSTGLPLIQKYLDGKGITDIKKREGETVSLLAQALSNRLGADSIALIATQLPRIMKDYHIAESSKGLRGSIDNFDQSNISKMQNLQARWETALTHLGLAALPLVIPLVEKLSAAIEKFSRYAERNPEVIQRVTTGILGLSAALIGLGGFTMLINAIRAVTLGVSVIGAATGVSSIAVLGTTIGALAAPIAIAVLAIGTISAALYAFRPLTKKEIEDAKTDGGVQMTASAKARLITEKDRLKELESNFKPRPPGQAPSKVEPVGPPPSSNKPVFKVENKIDWRGLSTKVTQIQAKDMSGPQTGSSVFDGTMNMRLLGSGYGGG